MYIHIWEEICYNENNRSTQTKGLQLCQILYQQNSKVFTAGLSNEQKKVQLVEYIQQLIMGGDAEQPPMQSNDQQQINNDMNSYQNTQNINLSSFLIFYQKYKLSEKNHFLSKFLYSQHKMNLHHMNFILSG